MLPADNFVSFGRLPCGDASSAHLLYIPDSTPSAQ